MRFKKTYHGSSSQGHNHHHDRLLFSYFKIETLAMYTTSRLALLARVSAGSKLTAERRSILNNLVLNVVLQMYFITSH
jgi:hypothetical protein